MIRRVQSIEEVNTVEFAKLGELFFAECRLPGKFDFIITLSNWSRLLGLNIGAIWIALDKDNTTIIGAIGAMIYPDLWNNDLVAMETFWFIHPDKRAGLTALKLLHEYEAWAKDRGAKRIIMSNVCSPNMQVLRKIYEAKGYRPVDVSYFKELKNHEDCSKTILAA